MSTWWIDEPLLMGSSNPTNADLHELSTQGFAILVCLLDPQEQAPNYQDEYAINLGYRLHSIPIRDFHAPSLPQLEQFVAATQGATEQTKLLVHCQGGTGRTGTMAAAYWISKGLSKGDAVARIRRVRPGAVEMPEQHRSLEKYERTLKKE